MIIKILNFLSDRETFIASRQLHAPKLSSLIVLVFVCSFLSIKFIGVCVNNWLLGNLRPYLGLIMFMYYLFINRYIVHLIIITMKQET